MSTYPLKDNLPPNCKFIEGAIPKGFKPDYESNLFNSKAHRNIQSRQDWHSFHLIRKDKKIVLGSVHFCIKENVAYSPLSAPYGSFELSDSISTSQLFEFIGFCEIRLLQYGARRIIIKNFPEQYHPEHHSSLAVLLINHQYAVDNAELGACVQVDEVSFVDKIDSWEKRKLKQAIKTALIFKPIPLRDLKKTYNFILTCRQERGQSLSMTFKNLSKTTSMLQEHFFSFGVFHEKKLIAASISIKVSKTILYNFYSAHSKEVDSLSPIVFLMDGIYSWCKKYQIQLLDLGTSALGGKPNFSLIDFKLRLGADPTMKLTFEKKL